MVQILPGLDQYLAPGIEKLGDTLSMFFDTDRRLIRNVRQALAQNPQLLQQFVDLEARAPGTLERLGLSGISGLIQGVPESLEQSIERRTRPIVEKTAEVRAGADLAKAKVDDRTLNQAFEILKGPLGEDAARTLLGLPRGIEQRREERQERIETAQEPVLIQEAEAALADIDPDVDLLARQVAEGGEFDSSKVFEISKDPNKWRVFQTAVDAHRQRLDREGKELEEIEKEIKGTALQIAEEIDTPYMGDIMPQLQAAYPGVSEGILANAAFEAADATRKAQQARTVDQNRLRLLYRARILPSLGILNALEAQGVLWNSKMDAAISELRGTVWAGTGLLQRLGIGGSATSTDLPSNLLREQMRKAMTPSELEYFNAALGIVEGELRPQTGLRFEPGETQRYIQMLVGKEEERNNPDIIARKREARLQSADALRQAAGLRPTEIPTPEITLSTETIIDASRRERLRNIALETARELLKMSNDNSKNAIQFLKQERIGKASTGKVPNEAFDETMGILRLVEEIDRELNALKGTNVDILKRRIEELNKRRNEILGIPVRNNTTTKAPTQPQFIVALQTHITRLENQLPGLTGRQREEAEENLRLLKEILQQQQSGR